jgi:hypothetical protein
VAARLASVCGEPEACEDVGNVAAAVGHSPIAGLPDLARERREPAAVTRELPRDDPELLRLALERVIADRLHVVQVLGLGGFVDRKSGVQEAQPPTEAAGEGLI